MGKIDIEKRYGSLRLDDNWADALEAYIRDGEPDFEDEDDEEPINHPDTGMERKMSKARGHRVKLQLVTGQKLFGRVCGFQTRTNAYADGWAILYFTSNEGTNYGFREDEISDIKTVD
ncbi:MAG: hypothetical protein IKQ92_11960 [Clostridia bacterium]|nr:hypothetical protein [Clostridia bacterium]